jgi:hypothetical protein
MSDTRTARTEEQMQTDALESICDELNELNDHIKVYLKFMALSVLAGTCGDGNKKAREAAAINVLNYVGEGKPDGGE